MEGDCRVSVAVGAAVYYLVPADESGFLFVGMFLVSSGLARAAIRLSAICADDVDRYILLHMYAYAHACCAAGTG